MTKQIVGNRDKLFKGQQAQEEVVCFFRKHWITILPTVLGVIIFMTVEALLFLSFPFYKNLFVSNASISLLLVGLMILSTAYLHKAFMRILRHFMETIIFTNSRVIEHKKSIFIHDSQEILDLAKIQDVKKSQDGIIKNILRYGDLTLTLSSNESTKLITSVPNVNFHLRCLGRIKRDALLQSRIPGFIGGRPHASGFYPIEESMETIGMEVENALSENKE